VRDVTPRPIRDRASSSKIRITTPGKKPRWMRIVQWNSATLGKLTYTVGTPNGGNAHQLRPVSRRREILLPRMRQDPALCWSSIR